MSRGTQEQVRSLAFSSTGLSPSLIALSRDLRLKFQFVTLRTNLGWFLPALQLPIRIGPRTTKLIGFRLFPFRSPLLRECFLFLEVLRCFTSPAYLHPAYVFGRGYPEFIGMGCPIRESPVKLARQQTGAYRSLATPFFGPRRQGILRAPLVA